MDTITLQKHLAVAGTMYKNAYAIQATYDEVYSDIDTILQETNELLEQLKCPERIDFAGLARILWNLSPDELEHLETDYIQTRYDIVE